ncbi:MAG TPA: AMP-binding protein, partial [Gaiellaceae bacterium]|nr:AMP-binding protein [Gaiellaceae bacterium]
AVGLHAVERHPSVLMRWFEPERFLQLAQEHRIQVTAVVPSMLQLLLAQPLEEYDLSELRYIVSGGSPLPRDVAEAVLRRLPHVEIREGYGLTETAGLVSSTPPGHARLGSVGKPAPGVEVRIDGDAEVGEICVRSGSVMLGYWNDSELTAETIRDGWLHTGDLGSLDDDGYLHVVDRKKDLIIRGGFNVFPRDVEEALLEHPAIAVAAVVGRPDETHGEEVVAFVQLCEQVEPADLMAWSKDRIGGYKYPREIQVVPALPLTPVGKIDRKALRTRVLEEATA